MARVNIEERVMGPVQAALDAWNEGLGIDHRVGIFADSVCVVIDITEPEDQMRDFVNLYTMYSRLVELVSSFFPSAVVVDMRGRRPSRVVGDRPTKPVNAPLAIEWRTIGDWTVEINIYRPAKPSRHKSRGAKPSRAART